jgi:hypothetical protein
MGKEDKEKDIPEPVGRVAVAGGALAVHVVISEIADQEGD